MKQKVLLILVILSAQSLLSQNKILFNENKNKDLLLDKCLKKYRLLDINDDNLNSLSDGQEITINYIKDYTFILHENRLLSGDYSATIKSEDKVESKNIFDLGFEGKYFRNEQLSKNFQIAFSTFENHYTIYVKDLNKEFYIEPLSKFNSKAADDLYVFYEVKDIIIDSNLICGNKDAKSTDSNFNRSQNLNPNTIVPVELNFCVDYSMYATFSSINALINRTLEVLNLSQLDFSIANGISSDLNFIVKKHYIITCFQCNYWPSTNNISTNMEVFQTGFTSPPHVSYHVSMFNYGADIKVFWQNQFDTETNFRGLSSLDTVLQCSTLPIFTKATVSLKNYSAAATSLTRFVLSHEIGHVFGCPHTYYTNTIMDATGTYLGQNWDSTSITRINSRIAQSDCWANNITGLCDGEKVNDLILNINADNKTINTSWLPEIGKEFKIRIFNFITNSWSDYTTLQYPSNEMTYSYNDNSLNCSNKYKIEITPICSGFSGISQLLVFNVPMIASPILTFDSNSENQILCSELNYTFNVSAIHPGTNPIYQWKVNNLNVGINSSNFTSNTLQNNDILSCEITSSEPCLNSQSESVSMTLNVLPQPCSLSNLQFQQNGINFFPNPVKNLFTVISKDFIDNVSVFNVLGQKLIEYQVNDVNFVLDLTKFSTSSYFVKIEVNNQIHTINIIKE